MNFSSLVFIISWAGLFYAGSLLWRDLSRGKSLN